jgi:hypothetical protein
LSPDILLICVYDTVTMPVLSRNTVGLAHMATGGVTSCTVIMDVQVEVLPFASVTERLTVCTPVFAQVYETLAGRNVRVPPQLSEEPLFISAAVTVTLPDPSRVAVTLRHTAVGGIISCTVTTEVQVAVLPLTSVTVRVTVLGPRLVQVKLAGITENKRVPVQLSVELSLTSTPVTNPVPIASSETVTSWQPGVGRVISRTVTTHEQVAVLPARSVARKVKLVAPTGKVEPVTGPLVWVTAGVPQLSVATGVVKVYVCPQVPASLLTVVLAGQEANVGGVGSDTVIWAEQVLVLPL